MNRARPHIMRCFVFLECCSYGRIFHIKMRHEIKITEKCHPMLQFITEICALSFSKHAILSLDCVNFVIFLLGFGVRKSVV